MRGNKESLTIHLSAFKMPTKIRIVYLRKRKNNKRDGKKKQPCPCAGGEEMTLERICVIDIHIYGTVYSLKRPRRNGVISMNINRPTA